jgi:DNA modification methylase
MTTRPRHPPEVKYTPVLDLPPLPHDQFVALREDIAARGVLVPILVDGSGARRKIIDGANRKAIADELGRDCPEVVRGGLTEGEKRTLARALNLARRQLSAEQRRQLIADQLLETPDRSNRWVAKQLGASHPTVAAVRAELEATGKLFQFARTVGRDGKRRPAHRPPPYVHRTPAERRARLAATTLIRGDCRQELRELATGSADAIITDPIYPEVSREYGRLCERDWHALLREVVGEARRVLKPSGSAVFILQPNYQRVGKMRLWPWEFILSAAREWNLVQDCYWWAVDALPLAGTNRRYGLLRQSVKWCVWLGRPDCYRDQAQVLLTPSQANSARDRADALLRKSPSGRTYRNSTVARAADERGGTTPFNCLPIPTGGQPGGAGGHPAPTPYDLAAWWCRYILPPGGVLVDPFCGSGTVLVAGLDHGASRVIGIDKEAKYLKTAGRRVEQG